MTSEKLRIVAFSDYHIHDIDMLDEYLRALKPKPVKQKPVEKKETSAFCENCGNTLNPKAKFCGKCGNQV